MKDIFFKDWESLYHVLICSVIAYITLFIFIRISGKRTLAKLNAFDFVVTVTLGSTLSSMILAKTTLTEGMVALLVIIILQFLLAWLAKRSEKMEQIINSEPTLLFYEGKFLEKAMTKAVVTEEEIYAEVRKFRIERMEDVKAVVMELNGEITVVKKSPGSSYTSLDDIDTDNID
ncbi:DUF421 domain-containing protein [Pseudoxanthomonas sp. SGD-10]|nr:DUF421 domain-containing protein [Pseudoxanthomonas sp. SGD-10]